MKILLCICILAVCACAQPQTQGSISEFHMLTRADTIRALGLPGGWLGGPDFLQVFVRSDRADVNQYTVMVSYESDDKRHVETSIVGASAPQYSLAVFKVPSAPISKLKVAVTAQWVEPRDTAAFE